MHDHSMPSHGFVAPCTHTACSLPPRIQASGEGAVIRSPSLSQLASGKTAAERKGSFTHGLPALVHAHAAKQTQILASHLKNMAPGALCADRRAVRRCSLPRGPAASAWWEQALMPRHPFSPWGKATSQLIPAVASSAQLPFRVHLSRDMGVRAPSSLPGPPPLAKHGSQHQRWSKGLVRAAVQPHISPSPLNHLSIG